MDKETDFNALADDIERRKTYYKLSEFMEDVRTYVSDYYDLGDPSADIEEGILLGKISIQDPTSEDRPTKPPTVFFRYMQQGINPDEWPLEFQF